jgi:hypothetical protein
MCKGVNTLDVREEGRGEVEGGKGSSGGSNGGGGGGGGGSSHMKMERGGQSHCFAASLDKVRREMEGLAYVYLLLQYK